MLPVKLKKGKIKKRYFNYLVFQSEENKTILEKRSGKGIWEGLYQFPLIETDGLLASEELELEDNFLEIAGKDKLKLVLYNEIPVIHKLSHQHIYTRFWLIEKDTLPNTAISIDKLEEYPVPVLIANFLNEYSFSY